MENDVSIDCPGFMDEVKLTFKAKGTYDLATETAIVKCTLEYTGFDPPDPIEKSATFTDNTWEHEFNAEEWPSATLTAELFSAGGDPLGVVAGPIGISISTTGAVDCM